MTARPRYAGRLPMATSGHPRFRWPSQAAETPRRCPHCGARLIVSDIPTAEHPIADLSCLCCSRVAGELVLDGWRHRMTPAQGRAADPPDRWDANAAAMAASRARRKAGERPWSRGYAACTTCGRSDSPYQARGVCTRCAYRRRQVSQAVTP